LKNWRKFNGEPPRRLGAGTFALWKEAKGGGLVHPAEKKEDTTASCQ